MSAPTLEKHAQFVPADATNQAFSALSDSAYDVVSDGLSQPGSASQLGLALGLVTASATGSVTMSAMDLPWQWPSHAALGAALSTGAPGNLIEMLDET